MSALAATLNAQAVALEAQAAVLRALAKDAAKASPTDMIDQHASPLGNRRHCSAVQRLVAQGKPGASIVGRRHLLTPEALQLELSNTGPRKPRKATPANDTAPREPTALERLDQNLKLLAG